MTTGTPELTRFATARLTELADPEVAAGQSAYLYGKRYRAMHPDGSGRYPFLGVKNPGVRAVEKALRRRFPIETGHDYLTAVEALWRLPHREEKYLAARLAADCRRFVIFDHLPLYRRMIVEGAWWDLVDGVASQCVGQVLLREPSRMRPVLDQWIEDPDLWIRRSALLAHLKHKENTDEVQLFDHCRRRLRETEFFIRKAIGWALRQYARSAPGAVRAFVREHRDEMSELTLREATKHLTPNSCRG